MHLQRVNNLASLSHISNLALIWASRETGETLVTLSHSLPSLPTSDGQHKLCPPSQRPHATTSQSSEVTTNRHDCTPAQQSIIFTSHNNGSNRPDNTPTFYYFSQEQSGGPKALGGGLSPRICLKASPLPPHLRSRSWIMN